MRTDSELQHAVLRELEWDDRVVATDVGVEAKHGVVTLTGAVDNLAQAKAAQDAAHRVAGVLDVANDLRIKPAGIFARTDTEIAEAVRHALEWDAFVPHERIQSTVAYGWVTLSGAVSSARERDAAEAAVRHLLDVQGITNRIVISPPSVRPEDVRDEIAQAFERRAERLAGRIAVQVADGNVRLVGRVRSPAEKSAALDAARYTSGVRSVEDHVSIDPTA